MKPTVRTSSSSLLSLSAGSSSADVSVRPVSACLTGEGEADDPLATASGHGELIGEFVDPLAPLGRQRGDRLGQILAVVVGCVQVIPFGDEYQEAYLDGLQRREISPIRLTAGRKLAQMRYVASTGPPIGWARGVSPPAFCFRAVGAASILGAHARCRRPAILEPGRARQHPNPPAQWGSAGRRPPPPESRIALGVVQPTSAVSGA
jgi:hypothetical protein